jgi:sorting nexin-29
LELYKSGGKECEKKIQELIADIWAVEEMPKEWNLSIICPVLKKGDPLICSNYGAISLLNVAYKILSNVLYERLSLYTEKIVGNYQCGFRPNRSTVEQIFTLRMFFQKTNEYNVTTYHLFIHFKSAYDTVDREKLYEAMKQLKIPDKLIRLVKVSMTDTRNRVKIQDDLPGEIKTDSVLRQGDALACLLFNIALEKVITDAGIQTGGTRYYKLIRLLGFADDISYCRQDFDGIKISLPFAS